MSTIRRSLMNAKSGNNPLDEPIVFEDANVKSTLVGLWGGETGGTAGNNTRLNGVKVPGIAGELTYRQAESIIILNRAFFNNKNIVSFNEFQYFTNVTHFINNEFNGCSALEKIILPTFLTTFDSASFSNCSSLKSIDITNVTSMVNNTFWKCTSLTDIIGDFSNKIIGENTFTEAGILNVNWGTKEDVPHKTFSDSKLQAFDFSKIKTIGNEAFSGTKNWTIGEINMPLIESIGNNAFRGISVGTHSLNKIVIGPNITSIGNTCFNMSRAITTIVIQATTPPTFGTSVFDNMLNTRYIYVPDASVNDYKNVANLSNYVNYIKPISELPN